MSHDSADIDGTETLIRYGLTRWLELRLNPTNVTKSVSSPSLPRGDGSMTVKVPVPAPKSWPLAFVGGYTIPVGSDGLSSGSWDPTLMLTTTHTWGGHVTTGITWNRYWTSVPGSTRTRSDQAAFDIGRNTSKTTSAFAEWAPLYSSDPSQAGYTGDAGVAWTRSPLQQWDARIGYTQAGSSGAIIAGVGYSFMRPLPPFLR